MTFSLQERIPDSNFSTDAGKCPFGINALLWKSKLFYPLEINLINNLKKRQQRIANCSNVLFEKLLKQQWKMQNFIINIVITRRKEILENKALIEMNSFYVFVKLQKCLSKNSSKHW